MTHDASLQPSGRCADIMVVARLASLKRRVEMLGNFGPWSLSGPAPLSICSLPNSSYSAVLINGILIVAGAGDPSGKVPAPAGSLFLRSDGGAGSTTYVKEAGGADPSNV